MLRQPAKHCAALAATIRSVLRSSPILASQFDLASFGELASDPSRVRILLALMDGRMRPAGELARIAGVSASTTSTHLKKLMLGGLLAQHAMGRHRYYRLASDEVADALEALARLRPRRKAPDPSDPAVAAFTDARTCWRHVAGRLGVALFHALEKRRLIAMREAELALTDRGIVFCHALELEPARWPSGKPCVDVTERRFHLGGPLGTLITDGMFARGWIARTAEGRTIRVTSKGRRELEREVGLEWPLRGSRAIG
jgi:DNA-binding transcriptional ArsR family regulator